MKLCYGICILNDKGHEMNICRSDNKYHWVGNLDNPTRQTRIAISLYDSLQSPSILRPSDDTWLHPDDKYTNAMILSNSNSKINEFAKSIQTKAVAYGKTTILSCPFAANCIRFCYQNLNGYPASARMHGHNYHLVYTRSRDEIRKSIQSGLNLLSKSVTVVRLNDNGDFISLDEVLAWLDIAVDNPKIVFYGYTKNTPHLYKARKQFGQFPSNFRVSISDMGENDATSEKFADKIRSEYPEIRTCRIIDSMSRYHEFIDLPFNKGEKFAYEYTSDFKIMLHVSEQQYKLCSQDELKVNTLRKQLETYHFETC
jgi:hypothetical protein